MIDAMPFFSPEFHSRVFMSYASEPEQNGWVRRLSRRLMANGIDVVLDQWDVSLGADLPHFMEQGVTGSDRVIAVCSDAYIEKANTGKGGVGYERKIMTADLMRSAVSAHIVPVIRRTAGEPPVPTFLLGSKYVDFRDDAKWETAYQELIQDLYGQRIHPRPALGPNPFAMNSEIARAQSLRLDPTCFVSEELTGEVGFPYEENSGSFVIGTGNNAFTLKVTTSGHGSIHVYDDPPDISTIALAPGAALGEVRSPGSYDSSSRTRTGLVGDSVVLVNAFGRAVAIEIIEVTTRKTAVDGVAKLTFRYAIDGCEGVTMSP